MIPFRGGIRSGRGVFSCDATWQEYPWVTVAIMSKYRLGWPDLLLPLGFVPALTGHFYLTMAMLAAYSVLYYRATHRRRGPR
jgi:hypothetical protein